MRDLGSTGGTLLDGQPLTAGDDLRLRDGCTLAFAGSTWRFQGEGRPLACAEASSATIWEEHGVLTLPGPRSVVEDGDTWLLDGEPAPPNVVIDGVEWALDLPEPSVSTVELLAATVGSVTWTFQAGGLTISHLGHTYLEADAAWVRLLALLAEAWVLGEPGCRDRGFLSRTEAARELGIQQATLNTWIRRARAGAERCGLRRAAGVVQVRSGKGQIRFGGRRVVFLGR